jgi:predicted phage terminase large subunit-like protein
MMSNVGLRDALLRQDFAAFIEKVFATLCPGERYLHNWHLECLAWHLAKAASGERLRLIINLPPRSLKSICASVALPAWLLGRDPSNRIIAVSYADELARKHARDSRTIMEADWYRRIFDRTRANPRKNTESEYATTRQGFRLATSIGGTLTGRGGNVIVIDDPIKPADAESQAERRRVNEWYDATLFSRLDNKEAGAIIVVMQRLHQDDLTGHLIENGGFEVVSLPAIASESEAVPVGPACFYQRSAGEALHPERESLATLDAIKSAVRSQTFEAQYQQNPVPAEGNLIKSDWLRRFAARDAAGPFTELVQSWDTASKLGTANDYSVVTTWGIRQNDYYLLDLHRGRWEFPNLLRTAVAQAERHKVKTVLVEDENSGAALIQSLRQQSRLNVIAIHPGLDKFTRVCQQSAAFEAGRVHLPDGALWLADLERELLAFPNGKHDDQVDSIVQFLGWAASRSYGIVLASPIIMGRDDPMTFEEYCARAAAFAPMPDFRNRG